MRIENLMRWNDVYMKESPNKYEFHCRSEFFKISIEPP